MGRLLAGETPALAPALGRITGLLDRPGAAAEQRAEQKEQPIAPARLGEGASPKHRATKVPDFGPLKGTALARTLTTGRAPGRAIAPGTRAPLEKTLDTDLGDARLHDGPRAARISRAFGARALTVGRDIYLDRTPARADSRTPEALVRHVLTHVAQNKGSPVAGAPSATIQRARTIRRKDGWDTVYDCYSDILGNTEPLKNPTRNGVVYVGADAESDYGGHAWLAFEYFERMDDPAYGEWIYPNTIWTDLVTDGIRYEKDQQASGRLQHMMSDDKYVGTTFHPVPVAHIESGLARVKALRGKYKGLKTKGKKSRKGDLHYGMTGIGKGSINCAKYVEEVLKATHLDVTAGMLVKTPNQVATGKTHGDFKKERGGGKKTRFGS